MRRLAAAASLAFAAAACSGPEVVLTLPEPSTSTTTSTTVQQPVVTTTTTPTSTTTTQPVFEREWGVVPAWSFGQPWGPIAGVTMFRGNPTRTYYGMGMPSSEPSLAWTYPDAPMCSESSNEGELTVWCGLGWTGQPIVYERSDGLTELIFGAYDRSVHFVDAATGEAIRSPFRTGDLIKGSVALDPDTYPLLYFGSRDNYFRIIALDRAEPTEIWSLHSSEVRGVWNNDWDSSAVVIDDMLYLGGENGWFFGYELNRSYDEQGYVTVDPVQRLAMPGYTDDLLAISGRNVSIESSPAAYEDRVYFTNSGGRIVGLDVSAIRNGEVEVAFDFYAGGDIDATPVIDENGFLYVAIEHEPSEMGTQERATNLAVGQLIKLNPYAPDDPLMWGIDLTAGSTDSGIWATPALHDGHLYVGTQQGDLLAVDAGSGEVLWTDDIGWHAWSSPVVVDGVLLAASCIGGEMRAYSLDDPTSPQHMWTVPVSANCVEATPVVWDGAIYIGSRDGFMRAFR